MMRISSFSMAISWSYTSCSLLAARYPDAPIESASAIMPASPESSTMCGVTAAPITPATRPKLAVRPSLNPYTTLRRNPPDPVLCHGSAPPPPARRARQRRGVSRRFLRELERHLARVGEGDTLVQVHVALHLLPLL